MTPAFVLHKRPYRESSLLIELLTQADGRITVIAKGAKRPKSPLHAVLQSFTPLLVDYTEKNELRTLKQAEIMHSPLQLNGKKLLSGFYLNELLSQLLPRFAHCEDIFDTYHQTLEKLQSTQSVESELRMFEKHLLIHLGYALNFKQDANSHAPIDAKLNYVWQHEFGFVQYNTDTASNTSPFSYSGQTLVDIDNDDYQNPKTLKQAKYLMRSIIQTMLGNKSLKSRELFC